MNEQIKKLVKRAGGHFDTHCLASNPVQYRESIQMWDEHIEKFAELIVRECAGIAYEYDIPNLTGPGEFIGNRMKKHFGVDG